MEQQRTKQPEELRDFKVMWSLRGRATVKARDELAAKMEFYNLVEKGKLSPEDGDCDGYEVDDVEVV